MRKELDKGVILFTTEEEEAKVAKNYYAAREQTNDKIFATIFAATSLSDDSMGGMFLNAFDSFDDCDYGL